PSVENSLGVCGSNLDCDTMIENVELQPGRP
ncbi:MAG: hypothetical protein ACI970_001363, partial [Myxococcota bacterium]